MRAGPGATTRLAAQLDALRADVEFLSRQQTALLHALDAKIGAGDERQRFNIESLRVYVGYLRNQLIRLDAGKVTVGRTVGARLRWLIFGY